MVLAERRTIQVIHTRKLSGGRVNNITDTDVPYVCIKFCIKLLILEHNFFFIFNPLDDRVMHTNPVLILTLLENSQ